MNEKALMVAIHETVALSRKATLFRNNVGVANMNGGARVAYGLGVGSPDLVGYIHGSARLFALEVKAPGGRIRPEQRCWIRAANDGGGYCAFCYSPQEALYHLAKAIAGEPGPVYPDPTPRAPRSK
jgi:hypothetical protein